MYTITNCDGTHTGNAELVTEILECYTEYSYELIKKEVKSLDVGKKLNFWAPGMEENIIVERVQ